MEKKKKKKRFPVTRPLDRKQHFFLRLASVHHTCSPTCPVDTTQFLLVLVEMSWNQRQTKATGMYRVISYAGMQTEQFHLPPLYKVFHVIFNTCHTSIGEL